MEPKKDESNVYALPGIDPALIREPPHNFEAEQALLGSILVNNAAYHRVAEFLKGEHFADPLHGKLFDSLARLIERGRPGPGLVSHMLVGKYCDHLPLERGHRGQADERPL